MFGIGKVVHSGVKLGKLPARKDPRTLCFATYKTALAPAPATYDFSARLQNLGMCMNDTLGDCTCAGIAHVVQAWVEFNGGSFLPADAAVLSLYEDACGYNPANPSTDRGGILLDVLKYVKTNPFEGHEIDAYVAINPRDQGEVKQALYYFGGLYIGVQLPLLAQTQAVWDVPWYGTFGNARPGTWGGHCIAGILDYDEVGLTAITWGALKHMTWKWFETYCDEAYCILSPDWYGAGRVAPTGFDSAQLAADLAALEAN